MGNGTQSLRRSLIVALVVACALLPACSDKVPHNLRVEGMELVISSQNDTCIGSFDTAKMLMTDGVLDIRFADTYMAFPVLSNVMNSSLIESKNKISAENNHMHLVGVTLRYSVNEGDALGQQLSNFLPATFFRHTSGYLPIGSTRIIPVAAVPPELGQLIQNSGVVEPLYKSIEILLHMTVEAQLLDGTSIQSNEYTFPLRICNGCLLRTPPAGNCCVLGGDFEYPCRFGNDETIDCRACCEHFGPNAVDLAGDPLCENPTCGDGVCDEPSETSATCPADCS